MSLNNQKAESLKEPKTHLLIFSQYFESYSHFNKELIQVFLAITRLQHKKLSILI